MAKALHKQEIDKNIFNVFIRDLSQGLNINLKHMIEDCILDKTPDNLEKKKKTKNKKKKDIIIERQNIIREKKCIEDDLRKVEFLFDNCDKLNPKESFQKLKTEKGKLSFKLKLLNYYWKHKKECLSQLLLLYYNLNKDDIIEDSDKKIIKKIEKIIDTHDTKTYMMKEMGNMLPPLNYLDEKKFQFEEWQINTIKNVKNNESVIVKAPTSSGKSFIAMSAGIFHNKIIYICPTKPVVYQVGAYFTYMGFKVHYLVEGQSHYSYDKNTRIFIGVPETIENEITNIGINFDYAVYDEIHNINNYNDGNIYENLIKLIDCNFLALSATIKNPEYLLNIFQKINPDKKINYVDYNQRFINHQRWIYNDKLEKVHPISIYNEITSEIKQNQLFFTPNDCSILWEKIEEVFEDINEDTNILEGFSPDEYFHEKGMLTLDDCKDYENVLRNKLLELYEKYPDETKKILQSFHTNHEKNNHNIERLFNLIVSAKNNDFYPMIMFNTCEITCRNIFYDLYDHLTKRELEEYPYHYIILKYKQKLYEEYLSKKETFKSSIKVTSKNADYEIKDKIENFDKKERLIFIQKVILFYEQKINYIQKNEDDNLRKNQIKNLHKELNYFKKFPDFQKQDIYKKHKDFIFTKSNEPMSGETIKSIRNEIKKTLNIKIPYESPLFQLLKRGIGIYVENQPEEYRWILQKLLSKKEIGIVISDKTLCMGIDLPVRTTCLLGINNTFTKEDYLQMCGRAGRRGKDNQGNIIFYGDIDHIDLMKSDLTEIRGNNKSIYNNYDILSVKYDISKIYKNFINQERKVIHVYEPITINQKLLWSLRFYKNAYNFTTSIDFLEKKIFNLNENKREVFLIEQIFKIIEKDSFIIDDFKLRKIKNNSSLELFQELLQLCITIYNNLNYQKYYTLRTTIFKVVEIIKPMIFNYII